MEQYLQETPLLNFSASSIQQLMKSRNWEFLAPDLRIRHIDDFVRDEILFGCNADDNLPASAVLSDGYGQCNTKGTLLMALFRGTGIPCRIHVFTVDKQLQKGTMTGIVYQSAPREIVHSRVEAYFDGVWYELEAFILDKAYLSQLQRLNAACTGPFCGHGVAVKNCRSPVIDFNHNNTYIQSEAICRDFGVYDCPDDFLGSTASSSRQ